jgi:hypothetical protein
MNRWHFIALGNGGVAERRGVRVGLRQAGRTGNRRDRLPAVLHAVLVGRGDARQEILREVPAERLSLTLSSPRHVDPRASARASIADTSWSLSGAKSA